MYKDKVMNKKDKLAMVGVAMLAIPGPVVMYTEKPELFGLIAGIALGMAWCLGALLLLEGASNER